MKFKSDNHRKAVFANMFKGGGKKSRVSSFNVKNFETKTVKMNKTKLPRFKTEQVHFSDVKNVKELKAHCDMCKRKGLSLTKGRCKGCTDETKKFKQPVKQKLIIQPEKLLNRLEEEFNLDTDIDWIDNQLRKIRYPNALDDNTLVQFLLNQYAEEHIRIMTIETKRLKRTNPKKYKEVISKTNKMKEWLDSLISGDVVGWDMNYAAVEVHNRAVGARDFADFAHDGYVLENAEQMNFENRNFVIPPARMRRNLQFNVWAQLLFKIGTSSVAGNFSTERMWVNVTSKLKGDNGEIAYVGELNSVPFDSGHNLSLFLGSEVVFKPEHIIDIDDT